MMIGWAAIIYNILDWLTLAAALLLVLGECFVASSTSHATASQERSVNTHVSSSKQGA